MDSFMKFQFIGDPNTTEEQLEAGEHKGPRRLTMFGYQFELDGPAVEVDTSTDKGKFIADKLAGNSHFRIVADEPRTELAAEVATDGSDHVSNAQNEDPANAWRPRGRRDR
jgi:hypothetical protein